MLRSVWIDGLGVTPFSTFKYVLKGMLALRDV
jgi:hypothetical protein